MRSAAYRCARFAFATARTREPDLSATCHLLSERSRRADRAHPPGDPAGLRLFNVELEEWRRAEAAADRIIPALGKEKNYRWQGEVYSSIQEFDTADKHFELALAEQKGLGSEEEWRIHWFMLMDAMMEGDDAAFREHAFRCNNIFPDGEHIPQVQLVSDMNRDLIQNLVRLDGLRATVLTRPDPKTAIALFETLERMHLGIEKRAVSRWLAEDAMFRKEKLVKSGDAQMALAYSCLDMKDYLEAKRMFEKLRKNFPSHPLCRTPENGSRKVDNLWNLCGDMVRKYNLALTSPR
jgi:tetratricopeptide (TPR) repeat protein